MKRTYQQRNLPGDSEETAFKRRKINFIKFEEIKQSTSLETEGSLAASWDSSRLLQQQVPTPNEAGKPVRRDKGKGLQPSFSYSSLNTQTRCNFKESFKVKFPKSEVKDRTNRTPYYPNKQKPLKVSLCLTSAGIRK